MDECFEGLRKLLLPLILTGSKSFLLGTASEIIFAGYGHDEFKKIIWEILKCLIDPPDKNGFSMHFLNIDELYRHVTHV